MANSLKEKSLTILIFPMPSDVRGNPEKTPSATPYEPSLSIAILSDGSYGVAEGVFSGFPLTSDGMGNINIVRDFSLSEFAKSRIALTSNELVEERELVKDLL